MLAAMNGQTDRTPTSTGRWQHRLGISAIFIALAVVPVVAAGAPGATTATTATSVTSTTNATNAMGSSGATGAHVAAREQIDRLVRKTLGERHRVEIDHVNLDQRLRQAPCERLEPFVPAGARLWGRSSVGMRCADGTKWNVAIPINVRVFGPALVASTTVLGGAPASERDFRLAEVELTRQSRNLVDDPTLLNGRVLGRAVSAGQPLRAEDLRVAQTVAPGDPIQIRLIGNGFEIGAEGVALSGAGDGQPVRVRTDNGKILSGTARGRTVEIQM